MRQYSEERKAATLVKLLPPHNKTYVDISKEEGIPISTIYTWGKKYRNGGGMKPKSNKQEKWGVEARFAALVETARLSEAELGEYCRTKGLYPEEIKQWKKDMIAGMQQHATHVYAEKGQGKEEKKRITDLEKELRRKEKALAEAAALLVLGKKLQAFYGEGSEDD